MKPILAAYNPQKYNYTKNIHKAVKCTLKTQIKGFSQAKYKRRKTGASSVRVWCIIVLV